MRALKTLVKLAVWLTLLAAITGGLIVPGVYLYTASSLPNQLESARDVEVLLRQSIESDRQSVESVKDAVRREPVTWPTPDFSRLPKHLVALFITATGCPTYFQTPREAGWPWNRRLLESLRGQMPDGDGACELIYAKTLARRLEMKTDLQVLVGADKIHRFLGKDQLVAYDLHSIWFDRGVIGVEKAAQVVMQKPLTELTLAELAEFQLAIPPYDYWDDIKGCRNHGKVKEARDALLFELAEWEHITEDMARAAADAPVRCKSTK